MRLAARGPGVAAIGGAAAGDGDRETEAETGISVLALRVACRAERVDVYDVKENRGGRAVYLHVTTAKVEAVHGPCVSNTTVRY